MKKVLILGMNSYIGNSFQSYTEEKYRGNYEFLCGGMTGERKTGQSMIVWLMLAQKYMSQKNDLQKLK